MKEHEENERKLSFKCCIPRNMSSCTDDDLRLSMATLKNAIISITVCMNRIDNELKNRGASTSYFKSLREKESPELLDLATIRE